MFIKGDIMEKRRVRSDPVDCTPPEFILPGKYDLESRIMGFMLAPQFRPVATTKIIFRGVYFSELHSPRVVVRRGICFDELGKNWKSKGKIFHSLILFILKYHIFSLKSANKIYRSALPYINVEEKMFFWKWEGGNDFFGKYFPLCPSLTKLSSRIFGRFRIEFISLTNIPA